MSKQVKRYGMCGFESGIVEMKDGPFVDADDYDALLAERDALKKDAERLDRLDLESEAYGFEGIHEGNRWMIDGPYKTVRDAIDAAMQGVQP
ncbi:hypothetical protein [Pseudomonas sp. Marseille-QA0892]